MRTALFGLILITACYAPRAQPGVACSVRGEQCPSGQSCVAGFCQYAAMSGGPDAADDAPFPDAPAGAVDTDKDGRPDDQDNCKTTANPEQADEDGDKIGDACDLCPQVADTGADADGDKIGDACDPEPGTANSIWLYTGFAGGLPTSGGRTDHWTATSGNAVATSAGNNPANDVEFLVMQFTAAGVLDNFQATTTITVQAMMGSNGDHAAGIEIWDETNQKGVNCGLDQGPNGSNSMLLLIDDNNSNNPKKATYSWVTGMPYVMTMSRHGTTYACKVTGPGGTTASTSLNSNLVPRNGNTIDIWAFGTTSQFGSVEIIGRP